MIKTIQATTRKKVARKLREKIEPTHTEKLQLATVVRLLKTVRNLKGKAWLVGGALTEGYTKRDLDIVITDLRDASTIKKALGSLAERAHFIPQRGKPPAPIVLEIRGTEPWDHPAV